MQKGSYYIPLDTEDRKAVRDHRCMSGKVQNIARDDQIVDSLKAAINRLNDLDNYPSKKTTKMESKKECKAIKRKLFRKDDFPNLAFCNCDWFRFFCRFTFQHFLRLTSPLLRLFCL